MGFASNVKGEMARRMPENPCCRRAELAGFAAAAGFEKDAEGTVFVGARHPAIARKLLVLARDAFGWRPRVVARRGPRNRRIVRLEFPPGDGEAWKQFARGGGDAQAPCCRGAYVRGAFLAAGYVVDPQKGYHLEWVFPSRERAAELERCLAAEGVDAKTMRRKGDFVVYIKEADAVSEVFSLAGAHHTLLQFEDVRVMKGVRNRVNRLVNAETANVGKAVAAALKQGEAIRRLHRRVGLGTLPAKLRAVAEARLAFPYVSLKELGERMDPPLSKSALGHRMRRLMEIAEDEGADPVPETRGEGIHAPAGRNWDAAGEFPRRRPTRRRRQGNVPRPPGGG